MGILSKMTGGKNPEWWASAPRVFKDSKGRWYRRFVDEMLVPIRRMEQLLIVNREISNRISDDDLKVFLENHEGLLISDKPEAEKLKLLNQHVLNLKARIEAPIAAPDQLMKLVCIMYVREDQDPYVFDEQLEDDKREFLLREKSGHLADFFHKAGLSAYLPSPGSLQSGTEKLLKQSQELQALGRKQEQEIAATLT